MDGNEIRFKQQFRLALRGYNVHDVDMLLERIASALDNRQSPAALITGAGLRVGLKGYSIEDVDEFLKRCTSQHGANGSDQSPAEVSDFSQNTEGSAVSKRAGRKTREQALLKQAEIEWNRFPLLPGKRFCLTPSGWNAWDCVNEVTGAVELRLQKRSFVRINPAFVSYQGRNYRWQRTGKKRLNTWDLVNTSTGSPVLRRSGAHRDQRAGTKITLAGADYRFPVIGLRSRAIMSALDQSGRHVIEYRTVKRKSKRTIEILIYPEALGLTNVHLLVAASTNLLFEFFQSSGGGGS